MDYYKDLTPVEEIGELYWKREDKFAPLGYGSINGSKLRQCIWLTERAYNKGAKGIVSAASIVSPQLCMTTWAAKELGLPAYQIIGATKPETAVKAPSVAIAAMLGAKFQITPVAYNPYLQNQARKFNAMMPQVHIIEYGISLDHLTNASTDIKGFHDVGAAQVANVPPSVKRLLIPTGSANSLVSILLGVAYHRPASLQELVLFVIGPSKVSWAWERLHVINKQYPKLLDILKKYKITIHDLHRTKFASYGDRMVESYKDLVFHPNYEGKIIRWLNEHPDEKDRVWNYESCFWVVGSEPSVEITAKVLNRTIPETVEVL